MTYQTKYSFDNLKILPVLFLKLFIGFFSMDWDKLSKEVFSIISFFFGIYGWVICKLESEGVSIMENNLYLYFWAALWTYSLNCWQNLLL